MIDGDEVTIMNPEAQFFPKGSYWSFWIYSLWLLFGFSFRHFGCLGYFGCLVRMFMCGCYYGYLDVYVWMLWMFGCLCVDIYDTDSVKYD